MFGRARVVSLARAIRSARRLLSKEGGVEPAVRARKELEIKILTAQLQEKQRHDRIDRVDRRYRMIKFIGHRSTTPTALHCPLRSLSLTGCCVACLSAAERQKVQRRLRSLQRRLTSMTGVERAASEEERRVRVELEKAQSDLDYIDFYPKGTKYIALFPSQPNTTQPQPSTSQRHSSDEEEGEPVFEGAEERKQREGARVSRMQRKEKAAEALQPEPPHVDAQPLQEESRSSTSASEAARAAAAEQLEAQRGRIRDLVKRAKAKATAGEKKAAAAAQGAGSLKEKRRRETHDDFFITEDEGKEQRSSQQQLQGERRRERQPPVEGRSAAVDTPRGDRKRSDRPLSRPAHQRGSGDGDRRRWPPPAPSSDSARLPASSSPAAPPSPPPPAPAAPLPPRSVPYNDRKHLPISQAPRNRRVIVNDNPSQSISDQATPQPLRGQRREEREREGRKKEGQQLEEQRGEGEKQQQQDDGGIAAAGVVKKRRRRKGKKGKSGAEVAGMVDRGEDARDGTEGEGAGVSDERAVERAQEQRQREQLRQSVQSILGLDGEDDED